MDGGATAQSGSSQGSGHLGPWLWDSEHLRLWDGAKLIIKIIHPWWAGLSSATLRAKAGLKASRSLQSASSCLCVLKKASVELMKSAESADCSADQQTISKSHLCAPMVVLLFKQNLKVQWALVFT